MAVTTGVVSLELSIKTASAQPASESHGEVMEKYFDHFPRTADLSKRWAMVIDLHRCIGCHSCAVACKTENNVPAGVFRAWVKVIEKGEYPYVKKAFLPRICNHCDNPPCVTVCPVKATFKRSDGVVLVNPHTCIGCGYCIQACPYDSRYFHPEMHVADKCTFCNHRIDKGLKPACVDACPTNAIIFGDLKETDSEVAKLIKTQSLQVLLPAKGTEPMVFYINIEKDIVGRIKKETTLLRGA